MTAASARREVDRNVADARRLARRFDQTARCYKAARGKSRGYSGGDSSRARAPRGSRALVARALPIVGGIVGGGFDASHAAAAGKRATRRFLPPKPKSPSSIVDEPARWSAGMDRLGEDARKRFRTRRREFRIVLRGRLRGGGDDGSVVDGARDERDQDAVPVRARAPGIGETGPVGRQASGGFEGDVVSCVPVLFDVRGR